jgi:hypothetical protein
MYGAVCTTRHVAIFINHWHLDPSVCNHIIISSIINPFTLTCVPEDCLQAVPLLRAIVMEAPLSLRW